MLLKLQQYVLLYKYYQWGYPTRLIASLLPNNLFKQPETL